MLELVIKELAGEFAGKVVFGKLNTDENRAASINHGVMSIPTLIILKNSREVDRITGVVPKQVIVERLKEHL